MSNKSAQANAKKPETEHENTLLVPILSKQENNEFFLEKIPKEAKQIILLLVIDTKLMPGQFGFAASDIAAGNVLMEQIKKFLIKKRKKCKDLEEWGSTERKILQIAQLKEADKIMLVRQKNHFYENLVQFLHENTGAKIEEIEIPIPEKTKGFKFGIGEIKDTD